jgi:hypothetical protein
MRCVQLDLRTLVMPPGNRCYWPKFPCSDVVLLCKEDAQEAASACRLVVPQNELEELPQMSKFRTQILERFFDTSLFHSRLQQ